MKKVKFFIFLFIGWVAAFGQNTFPSSGNVGIGTPSPGSPLHIQSNVNRTIKLDFTGITGGSYTWQSWNTNSVEQWRVVGRNSDNADLEFWNKNSENILSLLQSGSAYFNASDSDNAGLRILFDKSTNNNGADVDLTIKTNSGSPIVDWYIQNWGGSYSFNRGSNNGKTELFNISNTGNIYVPGGSVAGKNGEYLSLGSTDNEINFYSGGIRKFSINPNYFHLEDGNLYLNTSDSDNAGFRVMFDKTTSNNGADVDLIIRTNSGSPEVDWFVQNWGGSYTFNRGSSSGKRNLFRIETNGNIVVPNGHAIIDGRVNAEEVKVEVLDIPDYVFESDYELRSLKETKEFITKNKHLPEIPSANEIQANGGVELGDMNMRLLKKIEELTLYQIELLERLEKAEKKIEQLEKN